MVGFEIKKCILSNVGFIIRYGKTNKGIPAMERLSVSHSSQEEDACCATQDHMRTHQG